MFETARSVGITVDVHIEGFIQEFEIGGGNCKVGIETGGVLQ